MVNWGNLVVDEHITRPELMEMSNELLDRNGYNLLKEVIRRKLEIDIRPVVQSLSNVGSICELIIEDYPDMAKELVDKDHRSCIDKFLSNLSGKNGYYNENLLELILPYMDEKNIYKLNYFGTDKLEK